MQNKKVTMLAAVLAVTVIAMAGVGYAATDYYAKTTNDSNSLGTTYMVLTQTGGQTYSNDFLSDLKFNTENTAGDSTTYIPKYDYKLVNGAYQASNDGADLAKISNGLTLTLTPTNIGNNVTTITMVVTATTLTPQTGLTYTMVLGHTSDGKFTPVQSGTSAITTGTSWTFSNLSIDPGSTTTWEVMLFISGTSTTNATGFSAPCTFTFEAQVVTV